MQEKSIPHGTGIPVSKEIWESEYKSGVWDRLTGINEAAHYSVIVGYCQLLKRGGAILDVCCGEGVLHEKIKPWGYSKYVGIDISDEAI